MRHLLLIISMALLLAPARMGADAQVAEWIGEYSMNHDGHQGTLRIMDTKADCATSPWCHLVVTYTNADGVRLPARIRQIDQAFQHMAFDIAFPGNAQRFDAYLMSWDKAKMAGTTEWGQRTFGFYAIKAARPATTRLGAARLEAMQTRPVRRPPDAQTPTPAPAEELPQPPSAGTGRVIAADGAVETPMPDGSTRRARPGSCGFTTVFPDGRKTSIACVQVPKATPPVPDGTSAAWLDAHSESLLNIARQLLGDQAASIDNYLKSVESEPLGVYDRIRLRTDLITKLTGLM